MWWLPRTDLTEDTANTFTPSCFCSKADLEHDLPEVAISEMERATRPSATNLPQARNTIDPPTQASTPAAQEQPTAPDVPGRSAVARRQNRNILLDDEEEEVQPRESNESTANLEPGTAKAVVQSHRHDNALMNERLKALNMWRDTAKSRLEKLREVQSQRDAVHKELQASNRELEASEMRYAELIRRYEEMRSSHAAEKAAASEQHNVQEALQQSKEMEQKYNDLLKHAADLQKKIDDLSKKNEDFGKQHDELHQQYTEIVIKLDGTQSQYNDTLTALTTAQKEQAESNKQYQEVQEKLKTQDAVSRQAQANLMAIFKENQDLRKERDQAKATPKDSKDLKKLQQLLVQKEKTISEYTEKLDQANAKLAVALEEKTTAEQQAQDLRSKLSTAMSLSTKIQDAQKELQDLVRAQQPSPRVAEGPSASPSLPAAPNVASASAHPSSVQPSRKRPAGEMAGPIEGFQGRKGTGRRLPNFLRRTPPPAAAPPLPPSPVQPTQGVNPYRPWAKPRPLPVVKKEESSDESEGEEDSSEEDDTESVSEGIQSQLSDFFHTD